MKFTSRNLFQVGMGLLIAALSIWALFSLRGRRADSRRETGELSPHRDRNPFDPPPRGGRSSVRTATEVDRLKTRWKESAKDLDHGAAITEAHVALAKETANLLMCGQDAIHLIEFLKANNLQIAARLIQEEIGKLFSGSRASEARAILAGLQDDTGPGKRNYRQDWSYHAGLGCPEEEFGSFIERLSNPTCAQEALFGRTSSLISTDPEQAILRTLGALENSAHSLRKDDILNVLMRRLSPVADFQKIESLLPENSSSGTRSRHALLATWANSDPAAAADHVVRHSGRLQPDLIGTITSTVMLKNPGNTREWVNRFPPGDYFDAAAWMAISFETDVNPTAAREIALRIGDEQLRNERLAFIEAKRLEDTRPRTGNYK